METPVRKTVMIVEDQDAVRGIVHKWLSEMFPLIDIIPTKTAEEALARVWCHSVKVDIVIMDIGLPGMQGIDAVRQIKQISPATQAVMLTCKKGDEYYAQSMAAGAAFYVVKEKAGIDLRKVMKKLLGQEVQNKPGPLSEVAAAGPDPAVQTALGVLS
ncbi:MAG: hypothetical protein C0404_03175 [Verrucomicrobia bacterium]|nr:hypothetical protein [Verrucomicrobiota bacterium]